MVYNTLTIARQTDVELVRGALKRSRVVALLGLRAMRQDHAGTPVCVGGLAQLLRSGRAAQPRPP